MPNGLSPEMQAWTKAWKDTTAKGKSASEALTAANKARQTASQQSTLAKIATAFAPALATVTTNATGIPQAFLSAFEEVGPAASSAYSAIASGLGAVSAGALAGVGAWQLSNWFKQQYPDLASWLEGWTPWKTTVTTPVPAAVPAPVPSAYPDLSAAGWSVATPEGLAAFKAALAQGKTASQALEDARAAAPAPAAAPTPVVITYPTPAPAPYAAPAPAAAPVYITTPAPTVNVSMPPIPTPMPVTGPLTAAGLAAIIPALATSIGTEGHQAGLRCMGTTGSMLLQNILNSLLPMGIAAGFMFSPQLQSAITSAAQKFVEAIYSPLTNQAPITPEKAPGIGAVLLSQAVLFGSGAHLMSIMAEASAPLKHMGIGYLAAFMADAAGFSRIAAAYQGMMIQWGLQQPMRYWALQHFRPMIPREDELLRMAGEYAITREEFNRYMPYHGYPDEWLGKLYELADRPLSPMLFRYLGEASILDDELLDRELRNASYNIKTIPYLKTWLQKVAAGELKGAFSAAATKRFRLGYGNETELQDNLGDLGYSGVQLEKATRAARIDRATELAEDTKKLYLDQYNKGHIEDYDLRLRLSGLGLLSEVVDIEVARAVLKRKPKPEKKVDPKIEKAMRELQAKYVTYYTELYRKDQITEEEFYTYLVTLGIGAELASVTVGIESARKIPKPKA